MKTTSKQQVRAFQFWGDVILKVMIKCPEVTDSSIIIVPSQSKIGGVAQWLESLTRHMSVVNLNLSKGSKCNQTAN